MIEQCYRHFSAVNKVGVRNPVFSRPPVLSYSSKYLIICLRLIKISWVLFTLCSKFCGANFHLIIQNVGQFKNRGYPQESV